MGRRSVLLVTALVVAALGTVLVFMYVNNTVSRTQSEWDPVEALVATETIPAGTSAASLVESGVVELRMISGTNIPAGALGSLTGVEGELTNTAVYAGQPLLEQMFSPPEQTTALSLPKGTMGVSVSLADPNRVAGFVTPGSEVAIFAIIGQEDGLETDVLLRKVKVVAVGPTTITTTQTTDGSGATTTEQIPRAILTLALDSDEAKKVIYASTQGTLYFALLDERSTVDPTGNPATIENIFE